MSEPSDSSHSNFFAGFNDLVNGLLLAAMLGTFGFVMKTNGDIREQQGVLTALIKNNDDMAHWRTEIDRWQLQVTQANTEVIKTLEDHRRRLDSQRDVFSEFREQRVQELKDDRNILLDRLGAIMPPPRGER